MDATSLRRGLASSLTGLSAERSNAHVNSPASCLMPEERRRSADGWSPDARGAALAQYLRERAAAFSMSADVTGVQDTARAGMALLDAATVADAMSTSDARLRLLSEAGLFESMPEGRARFTETPEVRAAIQRPLVSDRHTGVEIIAELVASIRTP